MAGGEDKENSVWSFSNAPVTPTHLLSRSQPSILKDVKKSPQRREMARKPLASKDNNRTANLVAQKEPLQKKRGRPVVNYAGSFIGTTRPGPAPRLKSLVLRDAVEEDSKEHSEVSDADEELETGSIAAKLRGSLAARDQVGREHTDNDDQDAQSGLLGRLQGGGNDLQSLLSSKPNLSLVPKQSHNDSDSNSDREVETIPPRPEPLPHIPSAHTPFRDEDIEKLNSPAALTLRLYSSDEDENDGIDDSAPSKSRQLLELDFNDDGDEEDENDRERKRYHGYPQSNTQPPILTAQQVENGNEFLELEPTYGCEGLTVKELESLLE
ncbi:LAFA_0E05600g1_1 [Lachancea sp. 'fantastica']|nr:LAFA_0E05600g1_1 [Lachancea sp. 'fantastica']